MTISSQRPLSIAELVPHKPPMLLLDRWLDVGEDWMETETVIREDAIFLNQNHEVPAWLGIEYMAQTIAAYGGWLARSKGEAVKIGFLVGTRQFRCTQEGFKVGTQLRIRVERIFQELAGLSAFACKIFIEGEPESVAQATLNTYLPSSVEDYFNRR